MPGLLLIGKPLEHVTSTAIRADIAEDVKAGVNGTPAFFNGELIGGSVISAATFETGTAKALFRISGEICRRGL